MCEVCTPILSMCTNENGYKRKGREVSNLGHVSCRLEFPEGGRGEAQRIQGSKSDPSHHSPPCVIANSIISMVYPNTTSPFA